MKRETVKWLKALREGGLNSAHMMARDALATDAEVRRLKLLLRRLDSEGWTDRVCAGVAAALKPKRGKR